MQLLAPASARLPNAARKLPVLIADSDEISLDAMRRHLLLRGYEVETATGGVACLGKLRRRTGGMILVLDLTLSWGGGDGVLAVMRQEPLLARVPVVLTRARPLEPARPDVSSFPVPHVLVKPFPVESLFECILSLTVERNRLINRCLPSKGRPNAGRWS